MGQYVEYSMAFILNKLESEILKRKQGKIVLIGHSYGSWIVIQLCQRLKVDALVLITPLFMIVEEQRKQEEALMKLPLLLIAFLRWLDR